MRSWWMRLGERDDDAQLELREGPVPTPGARQLLVRMHAAALNRGEFVAGHGLHGRAGSWKAIGGEGAGEVVAVGAEVTGFRPGDRVMGRCTGAFATHALMEAAEAMQVPAGIDAAEAAGIALTWLVAFDMLVLQGRLQPGEWLLVNGISSGVGVASLQLAKLLGAHVAGTSGSQDKLDALKTLGLDAGLRTRQPDFAPAVMACTEGRGADLVVNAVGGSVFAEALRCMAFEGRLATVGYVDGVLHADLDLEALHAKRLVLFGVSNKLRSNAQRAAAVPRFQAEVLPHFTSGRLRSVVDAAYDFEQLPQARALMLAGGHTGKIVLRMPRS